MHDNERLKEIVGVNVLRSYPPLLMLERGSMLTDLLHPQCFYRVLAVKLFTKPYFLTLYVLFFNQSIAPVFIDHTCPAKYT